MHAAEHLRVFLFRAGAGCYTEIGKLSFVDGLGDSANRFLPYKERCKLVAHQLEDETQVLMDQFVILRNLAANGPERAAACHPKPSLQLCLNGEPLLQILPRPNIVVERRRAGFDRARIELEHFVDQPLFAFEVVVELTRAGSGRLDNLVRAGGPDTLFMRQLGGGLNNSEPRLGSLRRPRWHDRVPL